MWDGWNDNDSGPEKVSWLTKQLHKLQEKYIQQTRKLVECEKKAAELEALVADLKDRNERLRRIRPVHSTTNCGKGQL